MNNDDKQYSIKETVNKNIERVQFPSFNQHNTQVGWSSMNYPKVLLNPMYIPKPKPKQYGDNLDFIYQVKKQQEQFNVPLVKPFTNYMLKQQAQPIEGVGVPPPGFKKSLLQLSTSKAETKAQIYDKTYQGFEDYLNIKPLSCEFGQPKPNDFSRPIRQIGEVFYNQTYENEDVRHLKKLPNSIITEQNLMEILTPELKFLNLHNHSWINKEQVSKLGYFATGLEELILSSTEIEDDVLVEIGKSCKNLKYIDISSCPNITETGIRQFLNQKRQTILGFKCAHNLSSVTDYSLEPLNDSKQLKKLNISFCNNLTNGFLQGIYQNGCKLSELQIATVENLQSDILAELIARSKNEMTYLDMSFITTRDINDSVLQAVGICQKLQTLILTGTVNINDSTLSRVSGLPVLKTLKVGGLSGISDGSIQSIVQNCPLLEMLELNNIPRLSEGCIDVMLKNLHKLEIVQINFTPEISDAFLIEKRVQYPMVNIIRNINKITDIKDDGLRMPLPLESVVMQKPKKKKKKK